MVASFIVFLGLALGAAGDARPAPAAAPPAAEDSSKAASARRAAQAALAAGNARMKERDFAGAIAEYRRAQTIYPPAAPKLEFNIAKAEEARGDEPAAAAAFDRFLSQSLEIPPDYREEARNELRRLSAALGALRLSEKRPGLEVLVDGREHGKTPLERDVWVRPGRHIITLEQDNRVLFRDDVEVSSGVTLQITVTIRQTGPTTSPTAPPPAVPKPALALASPPAAPPQPPLVARSAPDSGAVDQPSAPVWKRWWFWAAAGAVVAAGTTILILSTRDTCPDGFTCKPAP